MVNGFQVLTIITKHSILDVAAALDLDSGQRSLIHHYNAEMEICINV